MPASPGVVPPVPVELGEVSVPPLVPVPDVEPDGPGWVPCRVEPVEPPAPDGLPVPEEVPVAPDVPVSPADPAVPDGPVVPVPPIVPVPPAVPVPLVAPVPPVVPPGVPAVPPAVPPDVPPGVSLPSVGIELGGGVLFRS